MSSVYRKGRDGYFYYQTYIYNKETGKKDKRIFHSLGTKNKAEAKEMQLAYDNKYDTRRKQKNRIISTFRNNYKILFLVFFTILITLAIRTSLDEPTKATRNEGLYIPALKDKINDTVAVQSIKDSTFDSEIAIKKNHISKIKTNENLGKIKDVGGEILIPDYKIEKINILSEAFGQGQINVLLKEEESAASQKKLCQQLTKKYSQFPNIIICIYSDDQIGRELASGAQGSITTNDQRKAWLAMYTYNDVEGEYFNDNPTGYLGDY